VGFLAKSHDKIWEKPGVNKKYEINYYYDIKNMFLRNKKICFYEIKKSGKKPGGW